LAKCAREGCEKPAALRKDGKGQKMYCSKVCQAAPAIARWKESHAEHVRDCSAIYKRSPRGRLSLFRTHSRKKAKELGGTPWSPTLEEFTEFTSRPCAYCGRTETHVGIDRYDNSLGYVEGNIRPCCWRCNKQKNRDSVKEWEGRCRDQAFSWMVATFGEERALSFFLLDICNQRFHNNREL
jgi:hypothetical protein